jgi:hypothetical protein
MRISLIGDTITHLIFEHYALPLTSFAAPIWLPLCVRYFYQQILTTNSFKQCIWAKASLHINLNKE